MIQAVAMPVNEVPSMTEIVTSPHPAPRRFVWLLPAVFVLGSGLGALWPGNSGELFCIGSLAGVWACLALGSDSARATWLLASVIGGVPILWLLGRLLDRLQADPWLWFAASVVGALAAGYVLLQGFPDLDAALAQHGSFLAFAVCAMQLGSYGGTLLLLAIGAGRSARA
ncbi:MAG TPA: hypothetical protein VFZ65_13380 [Planctomycetota bacterium]|nr:hypothetical protein [Planctomycetota bacterium]